MKKVATITNVVPGIANVALFVLWFSLIRTDALPADGEPKTYVLDNLSLQITILEASLAAIGIGLAVLGFFG